MNIPFPLSRSQSAGSSPQLSKTPSLRASEWSQKYIPRRLMYLKYITLHLKWNLPRQGSWLSDVSMRGGCVNISFSSNPASLASVSRQDFILQPLTAFPFFVWLGFKNLFAGGSSKIVCKWVPPVSRCSVVKPELLNPRISTIIHL